MILEYLLFMAKLNALAKNKYRMRLDGISGTETYLNWNPETEEVFIFDEDEIGDFRTEFTLKEIAEHKILSKYVQVCKLEKVIDQ